MDYQIKEVPPEEFDNIMKTKSVRDMVGLPRVFDEKLRLWPKPKKGLKVEFYLEPAKGPAGDRNQVGWMGGEFDR